MVTRCCMTKAPGVLSVPPTATQTWSLRSRRWT